mmetsp:Transcript_6161/g.18618  ORF Transcript_6161/g.18618 Transcript_6161/m.18618 type:complete len:818 (-) Transcript_6161:816-3269(-)
MLSSLLGAVFVVVPAGFALKLPSNIHKGISRNAFVEALNCRIKTRPFSRESRLNAFPSSLGAPRGRPANGSYATAGGIGVKRSVHVVPWHEVENRVDVLIDSLDSKLGVLLASSYEFPGRYSRWTLGFVDPPLELSGRGRHFKLRALNERGSLMLAMFEFILGESPAVLQLERHGGEMRGIISSSTGLLLSEEDRSKQASLLSVVRIVCNILYHPDEAQLGLYGSLGYDIMFQFEPLEKLIRRNRQQRDLLLYVPDSILVVDQREKSAWQVSYDFSWCSPGAIHTFDTTAVTRTGPSIMYTPFQHAFEKRDMPAGTFADLVELAKQEFKQGNLFEVVLSQQWRCNCSATPSAVFRELRKRNPSPYGFFMNLGRDSYNSEYLIGASPEMFVRVERVPDGRLRVETCPISGTIERGADALEDASQVRQLLTSTKDESELTMCTDVDRNDKSRVCVPGSISVLGRRQIEMYSRLIHTVDHVEGYLRDGFDALDAFLCHTWAVTVTGAPKSWAARFIEKHERTQRAWYGGAVGHIGFDGSLNTGLTLRFIHLVDGLASVRAGATLLFDSNAAEEEAETELKASAMRDALYSATHTGGRVGVEASGMSRSKLHPSHSGVGKRVLVVDHEDSFVHTLADYVRQTNAYVRVCRFGTATKLALQEPEPWDLLVLSPGPGRPEDFNVSETLSLAINLGVPVFGVCLGMQGMVEHFGGTLGCLSAPVHGKRAIVDTCVHPSKTKWGTFIGLPASLEVGRYHSLFAESLPDEITVTARVKSEETPMAIEHVTLPLTAVQFHPESILTNPRHGLQIIVNCLSKLTYRSV